MIEIKKGDNVLKVSEGSYKLYFEKVGYKKVNNKKVSSTKIGIQKPSAKTEPKAEPKEENKNPTSPLTEKEVVE